MMKLVAAVERPRHARDEHLLLRLGEQGDGREPREAGDGAGRSAGEHPAVAVQRLALA